MSLNDSLLFLIFFIDLAGFHSLRGSIKWLDLGHVGQPHPCVGLEGHQEAHLVCLGQIHKQLVQIVHDEDSVALFVHYDVLDLVWEVRNAITFRVQFAFLLKPKLVSCGYYQIFNCDSRFSLILQSGLCIFNSGVFSNYSRNFSVGNGV